MLDLVVGDAVLAGNEPLDHLRPSQRSVAVLVQFTVETVLLRDDPVLVLILSSVTYVLLETKQCAIGTGWVISPRAKRGD